MTHHGAALRALIKDDERARAIARNWRTVELSEADAALCAWAEKLTLQRRQVGEEDVAILRRAGFTQRAIHDACLVITYFNFVTRIALGLGVELESYWPEGEFVSELTPPITPDAR